MVVSSSILEFLPDFLHMEDHRFGFIGHRISKEGNGLNDVIDDSFELLSGVNQSVGGNRGWSVDGDSRRYRNSGSWDCTVRVRDSGPDVQGRGEFSWSNSSSGRVRDRGGFRLRHGFLLGGHGGLRGKLK